MAEYYLFVGTYGRGGEEKGVYLYDFDTDTLKMERMDHQVPSCNAGQQYFDENRDVLYLCDESDHQQGRGGRLYSLKLDRKNGKLLPLNDIDALMNKPCYFRMDKTGRYAMYSCHTGKQTVCRVKIEEDGKFSCVLEYDSAGVGLVRLNEDGSLKEVADVVLYDEKQTGDRTKHSHCHSANPDPSGTMFMTCDKGLDMIYTYHIDEENGKIVRLAERKMDPESFPRYSAYHPTKNYVYVNSERINDIIGFEYDKLSGELKQICRVPLLDGEEVEASDMCMSHDGRYLYVGVRKTQRIVVYRVEENGMLTRIQIQPSGEKGSIRGMGISPDDKVLLTAHCSSNEVKMYRIHDDGTLSYQDRDVEVPFAGNIGFARF